MTAPAAVGVLGGSFDPVHLGHLRIAARVRRQMELSRMLLLPAAVPPHKSAQQLSPAHHRKTMLRLALEEVDGMEICTHELEQARVCYTIDTLRALRAGPPPCLPVFVLGMDSLLQIHTWLDYVDLMSEFDLVVLDRDDDRMEGIRVGLDPPIGDRVVPLEGNRADAAALERIQPGRGGRIFHLAMPPIPISSSGIRARVAAGLDLTGLVPPAVAGYIQRTGLYRREEER